MKTIKVLHCIHSLSGGGAERQLELLCNYADQKQIENVTFCIEESGADIGARKVTRYQRKSKLDLNIIDAIAKVIEKEQPDIVHAWVPPVVVVPALVAGWRKKVPVIVSYRTAEAFRGWLSVMEYISSLLLASGLASNTSISLCSTMHRFLYKLKGGVVIKNAVQVPDQYTAELTRAKRSEILNILFVGRITAQKNWKCLIEALAIVGDSIPWKLTMCGRGDDEKQYAKAVRDNGISGKVETLGYRKDIYDVMTKADVLVLPSWYEGMPNVLVEAFALGLPVIASDIPSHRDILKGSEAALLFQPYSAQELADKIISLYHNPQMRDDLAVKGKRCAEEFTVGKMVSRYVDYYRTVIMHQGKGFKERVIE